MELDNAQLFNLEESNFPPEGIWEGPHIAWIRSRMYVWARELMITTPYEPPFSESEWTEFDRQVLLRVQREIKKYKVRHVPQVSGELDRNWLAYLALIPHPASWG